MPIFGHLVQMHAQAHEGGEQYKGCVRNPIDNRASSVRGIISRQIQAKYQCHSLRYNHVWGEGKSMSSAFDAQ